VTDSQDNTDLTVKQVASNLGITYVTALRMLHRDQLKGVKRGGQWRIPRKEFKRFKQEGNHPDSKQNDNGGEDRGDDGVNDNDDKQHPRELY